MTLKILLLEDVHASATPVFESLPRAEIMRLRHAPSGPELKRSSPACTWWACGPARR